MILYLPTLHLFTNMVLVAAAVTFGRCCTSVRCFWVVVVCRRQ
jgi:hypothetical protein